MMSKVQLYGHGYMGRAIAAELERRAVEFAWSHHGDEPIADAVVIDAAGYTGKPNVDGCEAAKLDCFNGNVAWPMWLEDSAARSPIVHVGSGCVYRGGPWGEEDPPNFGGSYYSRSKAMSQYLLTGALATKSYLLRVRMPFSGVPDPRNLFDKLAAYPKLVDYENSMTRLEDAARAAVHFALELPEPGIYDVVNRGWASAREVVEMLGLKGKEWFASPEEFEATVRAPRSHCKLLGEKLTRVLELPSLADALVEAAAEWKRSR